METVPPLWYAGHSLVSFSYTLMYRRVVITSVTNDLDPFRVIPPSQVRLVLAPDVAEVLASLKDHAENRDGRIRLISIAYDCLPVVRSLIEDSLEHLGEVALSVFPDWYGDAIPFAQIEARPLAFETLLIEELNRSDLLRRAVLLPWLKAARKLCHSGKTPVPRDFPPSVQAAQLVLAIDPGPLLITLSLRDEAPPVGGLLGLARMAEWLAHETAARVLVVVPRSLSSSKELDSINFEAIVCSPKAGQAGTPTPPAVAVSVSPIIGRPHPNSRGEQILARRLEGDAMLAGLFRYNIRVKTRNDNQYLVDLVWTGGKLVVEVDGYEFHSDRSAFSYDRRRDYELLISGYLVLRLPHDEVIEDVELAVERIRDVVRLRQSNGFPKGDESS